MDKKSLYGLILFLFSLFPVHAETLALAPNHPDRYVVVKGDTLWDISGRFLRDPWRWPEIWRENPQIRNPDLIYPGDVVLLEYRDGKPVLKLQRGGRPLVKLSPRVRSLERSAAIPTIPIDVVGQFLSSSRVLEEGTLESAPYVVSVGKEHLVGGLRSRIYARGVPAEGSEAHFGVYRQGKPYQEGEDGEVLGYEAQHVADVVLERTGDPATLLVTRSTREILNGDRLLPMDQDLVREPYMPHAPDKPMQGSIVSVVDGVTQIGRLQVVVLDLGKEKGAKEGQVLAVYQRGETIRDKVKTEDPEDVTPAEPVVFGWSLDRDLDIVGKQVAILFNKNRGEEVTLPDERAGVVMIFRTFEKVSYALVMESTRAMHLYDKVTNP